MGSFTRGLAEGIGQGIGIVLIILLVLVGIALLVYWGAKSGFFVDVGTDIVKKSVGLR